MSKMIGKTIVMRILLLMLFASRKFICSAWQQGSTPKVYMNHNTATKTAMQFLGDNLIDKSSTTSSHFFRVLGRDHDSLLVSGQNTLYNISLDTLKEKHRLTWLPADKTRSHCVVLGQSSGVCQNFIRAVVKLDENFSSGTEKFPGTKYKICGTNAFNPICRNYTMTKTGEFIDWNNETLSEESSGQSYVSYDPRHNSSHVVVDGKLFSATATDFLLVKPTVARDGLLRTNPRDVPFNEPHFVGGFADNKFVYFGIRETATEHINCGKRLFPRIARVCRDDPGSNKKIPRWTSFTKARLNCSVPGDYPFYFDELHGLAGPIAGVGQKRILYGVFTTSENSLSAAAICAFDMAEIENVFATSRFKEQKNDSPDMNWLPVNDVNVPAGVREALQCEYDSSNISKISEAAGRFIEKHPLMDRAVPALYGRPVLISTTTASSRSPLRFRSIDVLPQVAAVDGSKYDVLFVGTNDGRLLKIVIALPNDAPFSAVIVEEQQVLRRGIITSVQIVNNKRVVVVSDDELLSLPLQHCSESATCSECVARQDPHCAWHAFRKGCVHHTDFEKDAAWLLQNLQTGKHSNCTERVAKTATLLPSINRKLMTFYDNNNQIDADEPVDIRAAQVLSVTGSFYRGETLALAVVITLVLSLIVGFVSGYQLNRWRMKCSAKDSSNISVGSNLSDYAQFPTHPASSTTSSSNENSKFYHVGSAIPFATPPPLPPPPLSNTLLNNGATFQHLSSPELQTFYCHQNSLAREQQKVLQYCNLYAIEPSNNPAKQQQLVLSVNPTATIARRTSSAAFGTNNKMLNNGIESPCGLPATTATLPRLNTLRKDLAALSTSKAYL